MLSAAVPRVHVMMYNRMQVQRKEQSYHRVRVRVPINNTPVLSLSLILFLYSLEMTSYSIISYLALIRNGG